MVRVFLTFGLHPSSFPKLGSWDIQKRPTERGDRFYLIWIRPKAQAKRRQIEVEVPSTMLGWLPEFLSQEKPTHRVTYWALMKELEWAVHQMGYTIRINPRRFRHTCAREYVSRGMPMTDVRALLGVTQSVLDTYALSTPEQRGELAEKMGWGNW
jgi:integrase